MYNLRQKQRTSKIDAKTKANKTTTTTGNRSIEKASNKPKTFRSADGSKIVTQSRQPKTMRVLDGF
jgi:hypothetical protein